MRLEHHQYSGLTLSDRLHLTWAVGNLLSCVDTNDNLYLLFSVYDYYVELRANHCHFESVITSAVAFRGGPRLHKHLEGVTFAGTGLVEQDGRLTF